MNTVKASFNATVRQMIEIYQWPKCLSKKSTEMSKRKKTAVEWFISFLTRQCKTKVRNSRRGAPQPEQDFSFWLFRPGRFNLSLFGQTEILQKS